MVVNEAWSPSELPLVGELLAPDHPADTGVASDFTAGVSDFSVRCWPLQSSLPAIGRPEKTCFRRRWPARTSRGPRSALLGSIRKATYGGSSSTRTPRCGDGRGKRRERPTESLPEPRRGSDAGRYNLGARPVAAGGQRTAIALRFYAVLSVTEAAGAMGCSEGAVKTHTSRALAKLKAALGEGSRND